MYLTQQQHRSEARRYRGLHADTHVTAYSLMASHHAAMAGEPLQLPGSMSIMAIVAIHQLESERRHVAELRAGLADTHELPVVESIDDLRADLAARLAVRS